MYNAAGIGIEDVPHNLISVHVPLQEIFCSDRPHRTIWLAVHEEGVSLLNSATMGTISSYSYSEISTFGGSKDSEFIMVVSPQPKEEEEAQRVVRGTLSRNGSGVGEVQTEKLVLTMPKLQVGREEGRREERRDLGGGEVGER